MQIAILGAGNVGTTLGRALAAAGHSIHYGVRDPSDARESAQHERASVTTMRAAVDAAEVVLLTTPWAAAEAVVAGIGDFGGRVLIDVTNPIGPGFVLTHGRTDSGAEQVQRWATNARVAKAFNTTGVENMANPVYGDARAVMFVCSDDDAARETARQLATDVGFEAVAAGPLAMARQLEPFAMLWIQLAMRLGMGRGFAFGLLRR